MCFGGAQKLGYQLYDYWLGDPDGFPKRLRQILLARGIRGLIFPPQAKYRIKIDFDSSDFAAVSIGYTLNEPALHLVSNHQPLGPLGLPQLAGARLQENRHGVGD